MNKHSFRTTRNRVKRTAREVRCTRASDSLNLPVGITRRLLTVLKRNDGSHRDEIRTCGVRLPRNLVHGPRLKEPCYLKSDDSKNTRREIFTAPKHHLVKIKKLPRVLRNFNLEINIIKWNITSRICIINIGIYIQSSSIIRKILNFMMNLNILMSWFI